MDDGINSIEAQLPAEGDAAFWQALINTDAAAEFLGLQRRALEGYRHRGKGPRYIQISARAIRYRRADLRTWADSRLLCSTSDRLK